MQTFAALLGRVKATVQGALAHGDVPFQQIVSDLKVPRNAAYSPVFQAMFALEDNGPGPAQGAAADSTDEAEAIEVRICAQRLVLTACRTCPKHVLLPGSAEIIEQSLRRQPVSRTETAARSLI